MAVIEPPMDQNREELLIQREYIKLASRRLKEEEERTGRPLKSYVETFGCQMNARDSEKLRGILREVGYVDTLKEADADIVIYNTCTVRENADQHVYGRLGRLNGYKKKNPNLLIGLCGCMMQEPHVVAKIKKSYPFVDLMFGTHNLFKFPELLNKVLTDHRRVIDIWESTDKIVEDLPIERKFKFKSGVNIMFGCNNFCTYCIVPYVRGRERSRKPDDIIREVERLAKSGVVEIMLLGQNVNSYGRGLSERVTFAELLKRVARVPGIERVRFMTSHPKDLSDELIEVMAANPKICRHIHLPVQSGSSRILKKMNRSYSREDYLALVRKIRERMPDISLTTDIIVAFPGETEEDFQETMSLVREVGYDSAFTFIYSKRTGTPAAGFENQVPDDVAHDRFDRLLAEVKKGAEPACARFEGQVKDVLVEELNKEPGLVTGRIENNIVVHFPGDESLIGKIVPVKLDKCMGFYYFGSRPEQCPAL